MWPCGGYCTREKFTTELPRLWGVGSCSIYPCRNPQLHCSWHGRHVWTYKVWGQRVRDKDFKMTTDSKMSSHNQWAVERKQAWVNMDTYIHLVIKHINVVVSTGIKRYLFPVGLGSQAHHFFVLACQMCCYIITNATRNKSRKCGVFKWHWGFGMWFRPYVSKHNLYLHAICEQIQQIAVDMCGERVCWVCAAHCLFRLLRPRPALCCLVSLFTVTRHWGPVST